MNFRLKPKVYNDCFDTKQKSMSFNYFAFLAVRRNDYTIHFLGMTKSEALNSMKNDDLSEKDRQL